MIIIVYWIFDKNNLSNFTLTLEMKINNTIGRDHGTKKIHMSYIFQY